MKKHIYYIITFIIIALFLTFTVFATSIQAGGMKVDNTASTTISEEYIPSETTTAVEETTTEEATTEETTKREESTTQKQNNSRPSVKVETTTKAENHPATTEPTTETVITNKDWEAKAKQYPVATEVWLYMKNLGWSDAVCAGIMGNLMAEVGGQTLSLKPYLYGENGGYYGICQWSLYYYPSIGGADLKTQCNFLKNTIQKEINTYGYKYASGMNFNKFLQSTSPQDVALCFAKSYERCASASYGVRQRNAQKAYEYFVG